VVRIYVETIYYRRSYASADHQKYREDDAHGPPDG
jgi:hypothetical protein